MTWISTEEQLPDSDTTVLIYEPDSASEPVWMGYHDGEKWQDLSGWPCRTPVTHWRHLPDPPTKEA